MYVIITHAGSKVVGPFNDEELALEYKRGNRISGIVRPINKP